MKLRTLHFSSLLVPLFAGFSATATTMIPLEPVAAYAQSEYDTQRVAMNVINGSGLSEDGLHATAQSGLWMGNGATWFLVDLGAVSRIDRVKIWNFNMKDYPGRGLRQVDFFGSVSNAIDLSVDPDFSDTTTWTLIAEDLEIARASGLPDDPGMDPIDFATPCYARWFAIRIDSDWGSGYRGLSEMHFFMASSVDASIQAFSSVSDASATLEAILSAEDETPRDMVLLLGSSDAGYDWDAWDRMVEVGTVSPGSFTTTLTDLSPDTGYVARYRIQDGDGKFLLGTTTPFITGEITAEFSPNFLETDTRAKSIAFRRPSSCATDDLEVFFALSGDAAEAYASVFPESVVIPAGETNAKISFTPIPNSPNPANETLVVDVLPGGYKVGDSSHTTVTILDSASASAATIQWAGSASNSNWSDAHNWNLARVPLHIDSVRVDGACSEEAPIVFRSTATSVKDLTLGYSAGGCGALKIEDGGAFICLAGTVLGNVEGASGSLVVENGSFEAGNDLRVGLQGTGYLCVTNGAISLPKNLKSSEEATADSTIEILNGGYLHAYSVYLGQEGVSGVTISGGKMEADRKTFFADGAGSHATLLIDQGGVYAGGSQDATFGGSGEAIITLMDGRITGSGFGSRFGSYADGVGVLELYEHGRFEPPACTVYVGASGSGTFRFRGGTFSKGGNGGGSLLIRETEGASGRIEGWGTITSTKNFTVCNNGTVLADGDGEDRTLNLYMNAATSVVFGNSLENTSTNGWYATRGGCIRSVHSVSIPVGETGVYTWGEAAADEEIDLVNSARLTFAPVTGKISSITGEFFALDRTDLPALPPEGGAIGLWRFQTNGGFGAFDFEVRVDDQVSKGNAVRLARYNETSETWEWLPAEELEGSRVVARGLEPAGTRKVGLILATASPRATMIMIR